MIKEIIDFQEANLWKNINDGDTIKEIILIGKYIEVQGKEKSWEYLADINMKIVALKEINNEDRIKLENGKIYKIIGELKKYKTLENPKGSNQLKVKEIEKVEDENIYLDTLKRKEEILKRKKIDILGVIKKKIVKKEKINLLYIVSKNFILNNKRDILNDLYLNESEKKNLKYNFGLDFENESNIIRMKLETSEFFDKKRVLSEIRKKQKNKKIDGLVFIKGGGNDLDYFDDIVFCEKIVELGVPFITAIGHTNDNDLHTNDNDLLLSQLSDANYNTPTRLGIGFLEIYNSIYSENIKEELGSVKTKNVIFMFIIVILLGYSIFSTFFMKREVKEKNETTKIEEVSREKNIKVEEVKKEEKNNTTKNTLKENLDNLKDKIIATEKKDSNNNQKNISIKKVENKGKKLVYSEDYLYTVLSWKGYRGERAIQEFQKANGMKVTGKVDENLLKKLGIKVEYK